MDPTRVSSLVQVPSADRASEARSFAFLATPQTPDELGRLGGYRVLRVVGEGGMGIVFEAEDVQLKRHVALKVMKPEHAAREQSRLRFLREAQAVASLDHDHIVSIYQVGEDAGMPFMAMQYLQGESLAEKLKNAENEAAHFSVDGSTDDTKSNRRETPSKSQNQDADMEPTRTVIEAKSDLGEFAARAKLSRLPLADVIRIGREVADGLTAAHERGLIHRDIKPGNLWLQAGHGRPRVKILDFGLARITDSNADLTQSMAIMGTPFYMAPEQARGGIIDARADLFSLGCVLYRITTGQVPFQGTSIIGVLTALATLVPASPRDLVPEVPAAFAELIMRLLSKDPARRPPSALDVRDALASMEDAFQRVPATPVSPVVAPATPIARPAHSTKKRAVGIDLGTTYSAVSWLQESGKTTMIANSDGDSLTPTVVVFSDQETIVGKEAKKIGPLNPTRFAECVKREMGNAVYSRQICGSSMPPEVIQAWVLKKLKEDVLRRLGPDFEAVITVPAYFDELRRKATIDAASMAAIPLVDVVNEPTAAALAFGEELGYLTRTGDVREPIKVLVYDLGGGTFDVTLLDMRPGDLRTLATDGDVRLGGRDWDERLANNVADAFAREHRQDPRTDPAALQRLLNEVEEAKRTLSVRHSATVRIDHAGRSAAIKVSRDEFEHLSRDLLERTAYTTRQVLAAAHLSWSAVSRILLVGGATRMPMVSRMLEQLSGLKPDQAVHPDEAVARGAAIYAGYLQAARPGSLQPPAFKVTNVNSHSLGIEGVEPSTSLKRNVILIPRNTPLPIKVKQRFATKTANQRSIVVQVLEGESSVPSECTAIGRTVLRDLPAGLPPGWPVEIGFEYGTNGRLTVSTTVSGSNRETTLQLEREGSLSDDRLARWKQALRTDGGIRIVADTIARDALETSGVIPAANADHLSHR